MHYIPIGLIALITGAGIGYCLESYRAGFIITLLTFVILGMKKFLGELGDDFDGKY